MTSLKHTVIYIGPIGRCVISPPFPEHSNDLTALMKIGPEVDLIAEDAAYDYFHGDDTVLSTKFASTDNLSNINGNIVHSSIFNKLRSRMAFWTIPTNRYISFEKVNEISPKFAKEACRICKQLSVRITANKGTDLDRLLVHTHECRDCEDITIQVTQPMKMTGTYALQLLNYLEETLKMFHDINFEHNDVTLSNLVVQPSEEELKSGYLSTSLPLMIDFGLSKIHVISTLKNNTSIIMHNLLTTCRHTHRRLMNVRTGCDINEPCWILQAMDTEDPQYSDVVNAIFQLTNVGA